MDNDRGTWAVATGRELWKAAHSQQVAMKRSASATNIVAGESSPVSVDAILYEPMPHTTIDGERGW